MALLGSRWQAAWNERPLIAHRNGAANGLGRWRPQWRQLAHNRMGLARDRNEVKTIQPLPDAATATRKKQPHRPAGSAVSLGRDGQPLGRKSTIREAA